MRSRPEELERYTHAATVQDLVTAMLCGLDRPAMSVQTAASWGYVDAASASWELDKLAEAGFPVRLLPAVVHSEKSVGTLAEPWEGIPVGTSVGQSTFPLFRRGFLISVFLPFLFSSCPCQ